MLENWKVNKTKNRTPLPPQKKREKINYFCDSGIHIVKTKLRLAVIPYIPLILAFKLRNSDPQHSGVLAQDSEVLKEEE